MVLSMILLTGASGFVGNAILNKLVDVPLKILSRKDIPHFDGYCFYGEMRWPLKLSECRRRCEYCYPYSSLCAQK